MITGDNAGTKQPFGTIDTPAQSGTISGAAYMNFGWALTPQPNMIPFDGSTITVWVNGVFLGKPSYNHYREDIATLFPGLANSNGAVGLFHLDTTALANDVHTIAWGVTDSGGNAEGLGSRYFTVLNLAGGAEMAATQAGERLRPRRDFTGAGDDPLSFENIRNMPPCLKAVDVKRGYAVDAAAWAAAPDARGVVRLEIREIERIEVALEDTGWKGNDFDWRQSQPLIGIGGDGGIYAGYLVVGEDLRPLPIGSSLDPRTGIFAWQPGPGFLGEYAFVFVRTGAGGIRQRTILLIDILPLF